MRFEFELKPVVTAKTLAELINVDLKFITSNMFHYEYDEDACQKLYLDTPWHYCTKVESDYDLVQKLFDKLKDYFPKEEYILVEFYWE